jgi:hypothetical protein
MGLNCRHCGVKLFGAELTAGVCENCEQQPVAAKPDAFAPSASRAAGWSMSEWRWVRGGLLLLFWGVIVNVLVVLGYLGLVGLAALDRSLAGPVIPLVPYLRVAGLLGVALAVSGIFLSCVTPRKPPLRFMSWITTAVTALYTVGLVAWTVWDWRLTEQKYLTGEQEHLLVLCLGLLLLVGLGVFVCLCLHLRTIAGSVGDRDLAHRFLMFFLVALVGPFAVAMVFAVGTVVLFGSWGLARLAGLIGVLLFAVMIGLWLLSLLSDLRESLKPGGSA